MKCPSVALCPLWMTSAFCTATTGAPGEAAMLAPVTVGLDGLALAAAACAGGGAGAPVGEECAAAADCATLACGSLQTGVAAWVPPPSTGKRPLTTAVRLLISDCGVAAISWLRRTTDS